MLLRLFAAVLAFASAASAGDLATGALDGLIFDGSRFVLTYQAGHAFRRALLSDDGSPLASTLAGDEGDAAAFASSGHGYLSVTTSSGGIASAMRLTAAGTPVDTKPIGIASGVSAMLLRWDGQRYVLAWTDDARHRLALSFIGDDGSVSTSSILADDAASFALAARDGVSVVAWSSGGASYARAVKGDAAGDAVPLGDGVLGSDAAAGLDGFLVLTSGNGGVAAHHFDLTGQPDRTFPLPTGVGRASLARERYTYAMAWADGNDVFAARLDPLTGETHGPFAVATLGSAVGRVMLAAHIADTLVAYSAGGVFAKRLDDTGPGTLLLAEPARRRAAGR